MRQGLSFPRESMRCLQELASPEQSRGASNRDPVQLPGRFWEVACPACWWWRRGGDNSAPRCRGDKQLWKQTSPSTGHPSLRWFMNLFFIFPPSSLSSSSSYPPNPRTRLSELEERRNPAQLQIRSAASWQASAHSWERGARSHTHSAAPNGAGGQRPAGAGDSHTPASAGRRPRSISR